jgi:hypothetical protein
MNICEICDQPAAPHKPEECFEELRRKKKIADDMFDAAVTLLVKVGEPTEIKDEKMQLAVLNLDLVTWRYAM